MIDIHSWSGVTLLTLVTSFFFYALQTDACHRVSRLELKVPVRDVSLSPHFHFIRSLFLQCWGVLGSLYVGVALVSVPESMLHLISLPFHDWSSNVSLGGESLGTSSDASCSCRHLGYLVGHLIPVCADVSRHPVYLNCYSSLCQMLGHCLFVSII